MFWFFLNGVLVLLVMVYSVCEWSPTPVACRHVGLTPLCRRVVTKEKE